eukprot:7286144-Pyramimonas_sp.AAC.1
MHGLQCPLLGRKKYVGFRRIRLPTDFELLYLEPVLLHARRVEHFAEAQSRQRMIGPRPATKAPSDGFHVVSTPAPP